MIGLNESLLETGEKVSLKAIPSHGVKPLVTDKAFNRSIFPLKSILILKTHLQPIDLKLSGRLQDSIHHYLA